MKFDCKCCGQSLEADDDMGGMVIDCPSCMQPLRVPVEHSTLPPSVPKTRKEAMAHEVNQFFNVRCNREHRIPAVEVNGLFLRSGELAHYVFQPCSLIESRAVRESTRGGIGFRVCRGVYLGGSKSQSTSHQEFQEIDIGTLIITNQRVIFDGNRVNRNVEISKLSKVNFDEEYLEIDSATREKSMIFKGLPNPAICSTLLSLLPQIVDTQNIPENDPIQVSFNL